MNVAEIIVICITLGFLVSCICFLLGWWCGLVRTKEEYFFVALGLTKKECQEWLLQRDSSLLRGKLEKRYKRESISEAEYDFYNKYINKLEKTWKDENDRNRTTSECD